MQEIAMSLLDIANNSIRASASLIRIFIHDSQLKNFIHIEVIDNGCGMDEETVHKVVDPFYTTRSTRHIGLGIPLFKDNVEATGGTFFIESMVNVGTKIVGEFVKDHIDTPPMGDLIETMITLIQYDENIDFEFQYLCDNFEFVLKTKEIKDILDGVPINQSDVILWLKDYIKEGMKK